jgi:polysaccharide pyruvyl transferase WcaK-like protein
MKLLILHHYSTNIGDRAVLYAILRECARLGICHVAVSANCPDSFPELDVPPGITVDWVPYGWDIKRTAGLPIFRKIIPALHNRVFPRVAYPLLRAKVLARPWAALAPIWCDTAFRWALRQADAVISTGGHHLTSITAPDCVYPQTFDFAMAIHEGKPMYAWSQSIGPCHCDNPANEALVRRILQSVSAIYVRDEQSMEHLKFLQADEGRTRKTFESVFMLADSLPVASSEGNPPRMGVAIYAVKQRSLGELQLYIATIRAACELAISKGLQIVFFPMDLQGNDHDILKYLMALLPAEKVQVSWDYEGIPERLKSVRSCRVFLGHKTHSVVFALVTGTPVVALAYHPKTADFMKQFDLSEFCVPETELSADRVCGTLRRILPVLDNVSAQQQKVAFELGAKVRSQFEQMIMQIRSL